ncbi:hypothetical protein JTB14_033422 [Gonioctena quinquepunctata]|nr:hypothetical protein JTB14_033422 [Gonioctena quinquepunctata]
MILHNNDCSGDMNPICNCALKIEVVEEVKYLGINLDTSMRFDKHIKITASKLRRSIFILRKLRNFMNKSNLKIVFHALIEFILQYGTSAWGSSYQKIINPLDILQKRAIQLILDKTKRHSTLGTQGLHVLRLRKLYAYKVYVNISKDRDSIQSVSTE